MAEKTVSSASNKTDQMGSTLKVSFEDEASFFSKMFLLFLDPLLAKGYKTPLSHSDLGVSSTQDKSNLVYNKFIVEWQKERDSVPDHENRSLWKVLWRTVGWGKLFTGLGLYALFAALSFGPVIILNMLTQYFQGSQEMSVAALWICVVLLFVLPILASVCAAHSNVYMAHMGLQFRNGLVNMIYRKALKLSPRARLNGKNSTGQIVNMFSNDTAQLQRFLFFVNNTCLAPFQIAVALILIYRLVGPSTFVGLGFMLILMPLQGMVFRLANAFRQAKVKFTDDRVKLTNEILSGIRIIKYYAWEMAFAKRLVEIREQELHLLKKMAYIIQIGFTVIMMASPIVQPVVIFLTFVKLGNHLDAATAFTTIAYFNLMQMPFAFLPMGLQQYSQSIVSTKRMLDFFIAEELDDYVKKTNETGSNVVISMENANLGWLNESDVVLDEKKGSSVAKTPTSNNAKGEAEAKDTKGVYEMVSTGDKEKDATEVVAPSPVSDKPLNRSVHTIINASFAVEKGELIGIVGEVGSGKSSLLGALLGECVKQSGSVTCIGDIAFCDQRPWILNDTVKGNILFGAPYDEAKFDRAIHAANLEDDIKILPGGVMTEIGERGINLSGGQKARVALARAVYRDADVYLLDDPLSAVDAHVGRHLFFECIKKCLRGKTILLVTHHVHLLPDCDKVLIIDQGAMQFFGTYASLMESDIKLSKLIPQEKTQESASLTVTDTSVVPTAAVSAAVSTDAITLTKATPDSVSKGKIVESGSKEAVDAADARKSDTRAFKLTTTEERKEGDVAAAVYTEYVKAGGTWLVWACVLIMAISQCLTIFANFWLSQWGTESVRREKEGDPLSSSENLHYLQYFAMFSCLGLSCYLFRALMMAYHRIGTSRKLHNNMLNSVLAAPVAFFDVTPLGRILNRFSSDVSIADEDLSQTINQVSNSIFSCVGAVGAIAAATKGTFLILIVPLAIVYRFIQQYFRNTNTTVARLDSVSKSPIYSDFSQCLNGLTSIRAYSDQLRFITLLENRVDHNSIAAITSQMAGQWLAIRLDFLGSIISFFVAVLSVATLKSNFIPAGFLAIGLMYSYQLTAYFKFCVRIMATGEAQMNSVERILYYINSIIKEGRDDEISDLRPSWPEKGDITGVGVQMAYRDGPLVLKGVNFDIKGQEKVGVAGRTGSGKSSLMVALFRIQELAAGSICIDGVDISKVPLKRLRSVLGIIPQDPVMFSASVRFNLDPFNEYTDEQVMTVLESVCMKDHVMSLPKKLDEIIAEGGDNLSAGQRQLICIGRALLRNPKILVLDEATASIDNNTDSIIQTMVRSQFVNSTVLTIAHRLHTIIDCDKVMVLDAGKMEEFGPPPSLLNNPDGMFKSLWDKHQQSHHHQ